MTRFQRRMQLQISMLDELGYNLKSQDIILDLGCGSRGELVNEYRKSGYQAFGCSFNLAEHPDVFLMRKNRILRLIPRNPYILPFDDNMFYVVFSDQVFEHVKDYSAALAEINRVLKTGGISLHIFPSRYRPIEAHTDVPFGSIIQKYWWYIMWAYLGVNKKKMGLQHPRDLAIYNCNAVRDRTNYLTKLEIREQFGKYFNKVQFCEDLFLKHNHHFQFACSLIHRTPFLPFLFSTFHSRVIFFKKF